MAMDDNGTGRNYRRRRWISPVHAIQRLRERFELPDWLSVMKDIDLGHWLDEQVDKAIRHGYSEELEDDKGKFKLVKFGSIVADDPVYAVVRPGDRPGRAVNKRFKESIVTVLDGSMVQRNRQNSWKEPPNNPFGALAHFEIPDKPVGPECFGGEDLPPAPSAASLAETHLVEAVEVEGGKTVFATRTITYEPILITYVDNGDGDQVRAEEFDHPGDASKRIAELIESGVNVRAWRPLPFDRKTEVTLKVPASHVIP